MKLKHLNKKYLVIISGIIVLICVIFFLLPKKPETASNIAKDCKTFDPKKDIKEGLSKEECMKDINCKNSSYFAIEDLQTSMLSKMGSKIKSYDELIKDNKDVFKDGGNVDQTKYNSVLEYLTNGEAIIPDHEIIFSEEDFDSFNKESIQRESVQFLRKTFDEYLKGDNSGIFEENLTKKCNIVYGDTYGLDGFDKTYFKSKFVPFAIYRHISSGYDIFILFVDKPDRIFRVWIGYAKNGDYQLKIFKDSGVPFEEVNALRDGFKSALLNPKFSI